MQNKLGCEHLERIPRQILKYQPEEKISLGRPGVMQDSVL